VDADFVGAGSVDAVPVWTGSVGAGSVDAVPVWTGFVGAGRDNDGTMHTVRHDHERIPYPIRHMVR